MNHVNHSTKLFAILMAMSMMAGMNQPLFRYSSNASVSISADTAEKKIDALAPIFIDKPEESSSYVEASQASPSITAEDIKQIERHQKLTQMMMLNAFNAPEPAPVYNVTDEEYEILCRIAEAEATGGTVEQKANVVSCVFARVESDESWIPDTIKKVVFQPGQFSPIDDGRYYSVTVTDSTREAVDYVLMNGKTHDYIFFCSYGCKSRMFAGFDRKLKEKGEECYRDGIHRYYYGD